jgi:RHS repeat-associated protein
VLVNAADQGLSAQYEYSPFGDVLRATGPLARSNPFRFSTKFLDEETDLVYYGYRYYSPTLMRWISRDPSWERGGLNLYSLVANQPPVDIDFLGLSSYYPGGHHPVPMQLANLLPEGPGTEFLKRFTIPVAQPHVYDKAHRAYNVAVQDFFNQWLNQNKISAAQFAKSEKYAQRFVSEVMNQSSNSSIGSYLKQNINGAKALKAGLILGAASAGYSTYAGSAELIENLQSYHRNAALGDIAMMDLDAIGAAIAVQNMTGDYLTTMYVLGYLLD